MWKSFGNIGINLLQLHYCEKVFFFLIHLFARDVLLMKKLEIKKTKSTFIISVLKVVYYARGLSFCDFRLFYYLVKLLWQINGWGFSSSNSALLVVWYHTTSRTWCSSLFIMRKRHTHYSKDSPRIMNPKYRLSRRLSYESTVVCKL